MEKELEVKLLEIDPADLERKLINLNAKKIADENQENILFYSISKNEIPEGSYLRIRCTHNNVTDEKNYYLTYKQKLENTKVRENNEYTTSIDSVENTIKIIEKLGYAVHSRGFKHRISYFLEDCRIDIDTWDKDTYPYPYAEIEVPNVQKLSHIINILNIDESKISHKSIRELQIELNINT